MVSDEPAALELEFPLIEEILEQPLARQKTERKKAEFRPTDRDLQVYRLWAEGRTFKEVALLAGLSQNRMQKRLKLVSDWIRAEVIDDILEIRSKQYELLMYQYRELRSLLYGEPQAPTKGGDGESGPKSPRAKRVKHGTAVAVFREMRETLKDVRTLLGADVRRGETGGDGEEGERFAGRPRKDVILIQINQLMGELERESQGVVAAGA